MLPPNIMFFFVEGIFYWWLDCSNYESVSSPLFPEGNIVGGSLCNKYKKPLDVVRGLLNEGVS